MPAIEEIISAAVRGLRRTSEPPRTLPRLGLRCCYDGSDHPTSHREFPQSREKNAGAGNHRLSRSTRSDLSTRHNGIAATTNIARSRHPVHTIGAWRFASSSSAAGSGSSTLDFMTRIDSKTP